MSTTTATRPRRTPEEWRKIAEEIRPLLQDGASLSSQRDRIGTNVYAAQVALARIGSDPKGRDLQLRPITASRPATLAKRIVERRKAGEPWWQIEAELDPPMPDLKIKALLREHGFGEYAQGRTSDGNGTKSAAEAA